MTIPHWLEQAIATHGYWLVAVAVALESMGVPFPGETALLTASIYAGTTGHLSIVLVIAAAAAGAIVGDNIGYSIGYFGGYPLLQWIGRTLHLDVSGLKYTQRYFEKYGDKTVFIGRFISILRTWVAFFAGLNRMHWRTFFIFNAAGGITWATLYGLLGYFLGKSPILPTILHVFGIAGFVALGAIVVALLVFWRVREHRKKHGGEEGKSETAAATSGSDAQKAPKHEEQGEPSPQ